MNCVTRDGAVYGYILLWFWWQIKMHHEMLKLSASRGMVDDHQIPQKLPLENIFCSKMALLSGPICILNHKHFHFWPLISLSVYDIKGIPWVLNVVYHMTTIKVFWGSLDLHFCCERAKNSGQIYFLTHKPTILVAFLGPLMHNIKISTKMFVIMYLRIHMKAF